MPKTDMPAGDNSTEDDPFLWLEEVDSPQVREWVALCNAETEKALCDRKFERDRATILDILNASDRVPSFAKRGPWLYNLWQDENNPKGLWRRATLASYRSAAPDWEVMLDIDALAKVEGEDWVWAGCSTLPPVHRHGLIYLSRGGADAVVTREFDLVEKCFVESGFSLPEAKGSAEWLDQDTLLVSSALGGEAFETTSGYARTVRRWRRGAPFAEAVVVFECDRDEMSVSAWYEHSPRYPRICFVRRHDFFTSALFVDEGDGPQQVDIPSDADNFGFEHKWFVLSLRSDWEIAGRRYKAGALLAADFDAFKGGKRDFTVLFDPTPTCFLEEFALSGGNIVAFKVLDNVQSRILFACHDNAAWKIAPLAGLPGLESVDFYRLTQDDVDWLDDKREGETFVVSSESTLMPPTVWLARPGEALDMLKQAPARFDAAGLTITQHHAVSVDGQRIPYFQVSPAGMALDGSNVCLLTGYGGFQASSLPYYAASVGKLWLERGGVYAIANIRGGGEYGPDWHKAGMREGKKLCHDDFAAVAKDLIARGVTKPSRLACEGGSNGGLLVGNMLTRYPELFGAIQCEVPLLDMKRYTRFTAGPSWISEYGDPDEPEDWVFLQKISAYHHVAPGRPYPPILLTTSARDDRVHPSHARKMAAKLMAQGHKVYFYEPVEGGHGLGADNDHVAFNIALGYAFLRKTIALDTAGA